MSVKEWWNYDEKALLYRQKGIKGGSVESVSQI